jgi:predicted nucleic acid-binding protein
MDAFDADVLIYAATPSHPLGERVAALFADDPPLADAAPTGVGSVLLLPELLSKPTRDESEREIAALSALLARLELRQLDLPTARLATALGATYRLNAADAVHLATAVQVGADRFVTNNTKDFKKSISEITVTYPSELPLPGPASRRYGRTQSNTKG